MAKGIHEHDKDIVKALNIGADYVLVVGRVPNFDIEKLMIEPLCLADIKDYSPDTKVVWNSRDLSTGGLKIESIEQARKQWYGWLVQASNIHSGADIFPGVDAVLVGTDLEDFIKTRNPE